MDNRTTRLASCIPAVRVLLAFFLIFISLPGIQQPFYYLGQIYGSGAFGRQVGLSVAVVVPWLGIVLSFCLVSATCLQGSFLASVAMLVFWMFSSPMSLFWFLGAVACLGAIAAYLYFILSADVDSAKHS